MFSDFYWLYIYTTKLVLHLQIYDEMFVIGLSIQQLEVYMELEMPTKWPHTLPNYVDLQEPLDPHAIHQSSRLVFPSCHNSWTLHRLSQLVCDIISKFTECNNHLLLNENSMGCSNIV